MYTQEISSVYTRESPVYTQEILTICWRRFDFCLIPIFDPGSIQEGPAGSQEHPRPSNKLFCPIDFNYTGGDPKLKWIGYKCILALRANNPTRAGGKEAEGKEAGGKEAGGKEAGGKEAGGKVVTSTGDQAFGNPLKNR